MAGKLSPMPQVVVNLHCTSITNGFAKAGRGFDEVREILLERNSISFLFNKGERKGAVCIKSHYPLRVYDVWNFYFDGNEKKQTALGLDRVA